MIRIRAAVWLAAAGIVATTMPATAQIVVGPGLLDHYDTGDILGDALERYLRPALGAPRYPVYHYYQPNVLQPPLAYPVAPGYVPYYQPNMGYPVQQPYPPLTYRRQNRSGNWLFNDYAPDTDWDAIIAVPERLDFD